MIVNDFLGKRHAAAPAPVRSAALARARNVVATVISMHGDSALTRASPRLPVQGRDVGVFLLGVLVPIRLVFIASAASMPVVVARGAKGVAALGAHEVNHVGIHFSAAFTIAPPAKRDAAHLLDLPGFHFIVPLLILRQKAVQYFVLMADAGWLLPFFDLNWRAPGASNRILVGVDLG